MLAALKFRKVLKLEAAAANGEEKRKTMNDITMPIAHNSGEYFSDANNTELFIRSEFERTGGGWRVERVGTKEEWKWRKKSGRRRKWKQKNRS